MELERHEEEWLIGDGAVMLVQMGIKESSRVVDFGCGPGRYTIPLSQVVGQTGKVLAVERTPKEIKTLKERVEKFGNKDSIDILNSEDIYIESICTDSADALLLFDVLQYVDDKEELFKSVARVLNPTGTLYVYPAAIPHPGSVDMEHIATILKDLGMTSSSKREYRMMHNKCMVDDHIYSFVFEN